MDHPRDSSEADVEADLRDAASLSLEHNSTAQHELRPSNNNAPPPISSEHCDSPLRNDAHDIEHSQLNSPTNTQSLHQEISTPNCFALLRNAIHNPDQLTAMISNYSTSYNAVNVGIVLPVLKYSIASSTANDSTNDSYSSPSFAAVAPSFLAETLSSSAVISSIVHPFKHVALLLCNYALQFIRCLPVNTKLFLPFQSISMISSEIQLNSTDDAKDEEEDSIVASSLLAGMIFGQLFGGFLGDFLGRRNAMLLVMILQIGGSLGSSLFIHTGNEDSQVGFSALEQLALWRFLLGIGAGGVYPLAAVMSAENKGEKDEKEEHESEQVWQTEENGDNIHHSGFERSEGSHSHGYSPTSEHENDPYLIRSTTPPISSSDIMSFQRIALTFSTQGLGFLTVPLLAYPMLAMRWNVDLIWRLLLGLGALPGLMVLYMRFCWRPNHHKHGAVIVEEENTIVGANSGDGCVEEKSGGNSGTAKEKRENERNLESNVVKTHERHPAGSLELSPHNLVDKEGGNEEFDDDKEVAESPLSGLFLGIESDSNVIDSTQNENELPLVENSHLEGISNDQIIQTSDSADGQTGTCNNHSPGLWSSIKHEPFLRTKMMGTAGSWFLFDVLFYGNTLFEPLVLEAAFGNASGDSSEDGYGLLLTAVRDSLIVSLLSIPGYFVTVLLIGRGSCSCSSLRTNSASRFSSISCFPLYQTPKYIQMQGFTLMFLLYLVIGLFWKQLSHIQWLLLPLYAGTFFFANYGPNTTTFLLPSITFSEECRSTLNGISAAAGKVGALVGASVFGMAAEEWGESLVMVFCACLSFLALVLTKICIQANKLP